MVAGNSPGNIGNQTKMLQENLCPFSWSEFYVDTVPGCIYMLFFWFFTLLGIPTKKRVIEALPCMREKCKLWDRENDDCVFMNVKDISELSRSYR